MLKITEPIKKNNTECFITLTKGDVFKTKDGLSFWMKIGLSCDTNNALNLKDMRTIKMNEDTECIRFDAELIIKEIAS